MKNSIVSSVRFTAALAAAFLAFEASAQTVKRGDRDFVEKAAKSGMEEVDISRIAAERTSNSSVKSFAQMMVSDHSAANEKLTSLATGKAIKLPAQDTSVSGKWAKRDSKDFDQEYVDKMVSDHKEAVDLFQKEADKGTDPELQAFARDTLPKLQHHLEMAMDLKRTVK
jgi:putative membrane protein